MNSERRMDPDILSEINNRLTMLEHDFKARLTQVEKDLESISESRKFFIRWMLGQVTAAAIILGTFIYGYAQVGAKVDNLDLSDVKAAIITLEKHSATALSVLGQHGAEFEDIRGEQARLRGNIDQIHIYLNEIRGKIDVQTFDRFYRTDGEKLEERIKRLEDIQVIKPNHDHRD